MSYPRGTVQKALGLPTETPIREMRTVWNFELLTEDCEGATPYSPSQCPIARSLSRQTARPALVLSEVAYVVIPDEAEPYIAKFSVPKAARKALQAFDRTGKFESGAYHLVPLYTSKQRAVRTEDRQFQAWRKAVGGQPKPRAKLTSKPHVRLLERA